MVKHKFPDVVVVTRVDSNGQRMIMIQGLTNKRLCPAFADQLSGSVVMRDAFVAYINQAMDLDY